MRRYTIRDSRRAVALLARCRHVGTDATAWRIPRHATVGGGVAHWWASGVRHDYPSRWVVVLVRLGPDVYTRDEVEAGFASVRDGICRAWAKVHKRRRPSLVVFAHTQRWAAKEGAEVHTYKRAAE